MGSDFPAPLRELRTRLASLLARFASGQVLRWTLFGRLLDFALLASASSSCPISAFDHAVPADFSIRETECNGIQLLVTV